MATDAYLWRKSSYSTNANTECVEIARTADSTLIRDTQHRHLGHVSVSGPEWRAFLAAVRRGELD